MLPTWVTDAFGGDPNGMLEATTIVDLLGANGSNASITFGNYLTTLGFLVNRINGPAQQRGVECGIVAAYVVAMWLREQREGRDPSSLRGANFAASVDPQTTVLANATLGLFPEVPDQIPCVRCLSLRHSASACRHEKGLSHEAETTFLYETQVSQLIHAFGALATETGFYEVTAYDTALSSLMNALHELSSSAQGADANKERYGMYVVNTDNSSARGYHWFSVFWRARAAPHTCASPAPAPAAAQVMLEHLDDEDALRMLEEIEAEVEADTTPDLPSHQMDAAAHSRGDELPFPDDELDVDDAMYEYYDHADAAADRLDEEAAMFSDISEG